MLRTLALSLFFWLTLLGSLPAHAQIKVFSEDVTEPTTKAKKKTSQKKERLYGDLNCIKFNPWLLARGVAGLSYERILGEKFSVDVNLGLTYRDFVFEFFNMPENQPENSIFLGDGTPQIGFGPALGGGLMFYPKENDEFEGLYIEALANYRKYIITNRVDLVGPDPSGGNQYRIFSTDMDLGYQFFDMALLLGDQGEFLESGMIRNSYIGFGLRNMRYKTKTTRLDQNNINVDEVKTVARWSPMFYAGYSFGIPF